jgi:hypothetical protein
MIDLITGELERGRVYTVTLAGGRWTIIENMAQVGFAARTEYLRPMHAMAIVG